MKMYLLCNLFFCSQYIILYDSDIFYLCKVQSTCKYSAELWCTYLSLFLYGIYFFYGIAAQQTMYKITLWVHTISKYKKYCSKCISLPNQYLF